MRMSWCFVGWIAINSAACGGRLSLGDLGASGAGAGQLQSAGGAAQSVGGVPQSAGGAAQSAGGAPQATGVSMGDAGAPVGGGSASLAGAAGTGPTRGNGLSVCDGAGTRVLTAADALLDNFEGSAPSPAWTTYNDLFDTLGEDNAYIYLTGVVGGANRTNFAGLYAPGSGYSIGLMYNLAVYPVAGVSCADVSAFSGISFWAKSREAGTLYVGFIIPSLNQNQQDDRGRPIGGDYGGTISLVGKFPGASIASSTSWTHYTVKFTDAAPPGQTGSAIKLLQKIRFEDDSEPGKFTGGAVGFWIDELRFF
jgi:hypothetical protein